MEPALGIFEGGGAKGLAHIGALKATEENGFEFTAVAGTSAGSIVASLVAAGYRADELYKPGDKNSIFNINLLELLDANEWQILTAVRTNFDAAKKCKQSLFAMWRMAHWFIWQNRVALLSLWNDCGFLSTTKFEDWLNSKLEEKLKKDNPEIQLTGKDGKVSFGDLPKPLKIISANVSQRTLRVFCKTTDPTYGVAEAVGASIRIPYIFKPKHDESGRYVDGGIMSNFPAWVFDLERQNAPILTPTFGFRLVDRRNMQEEGKGTLLSKCTSFGHFADLFYSTVFGDSTLEKRNVSTLHEIPLQLRIGPLDFEASEGIREDVFKDAKNDTRDYFLKANLWRKSEIHMTKILGIVENEMRVALDHQKPRHLRVNVMLPVNGSMHVLYSKGFDGNDDCDDKSQFGIGTGACGQCWEKMDYVICDLADASVTFKDVWKMDKYQQRLVRTQLRSLLSIPMFDQKRLGQLDPSEKNLKSAFIGVLNVDSDDDLLDKFRALTANEDNLAKDCAGMVSKVLTTPTH